MDSGAFSELSQHGQYRSEPEDYAEQVKRWNTCGNMLAAVSQDWMCEPFIVAKTGLSVQAHQDRTISRYCELRALCRGVYIMPVLQGYAVRDYCLHVSAYGPALAHAAWVEVGSVCKRNSSVHAIEEILLAIKARRPDLRLHGFGLKTTALASATICDLLHSADSMAWSYAARKQGRNANDWREAKAFEARIHTQPQQWSLL